MSIKIDINTTDIPMDLNSNAENPGEINNNEVIIDIHSTSPEQINIKPQIINDYYSLSRNYMSSTSQ